MFKAMFAGLALGAMLGGAAQAQDKVTGYAPVNGLDVYYEIEGQGEPLLLLHGAYMSIETNWRELMPVLAETHKVIAIELQAHGRTNDVDRPITYEGMADDVAALLEHLEIEQAAVFGYSMGAGVGIRLAMQHPEKVNRLIAASASISSDGLPEDFDEMIATITPEMFKGTSLETEYLRLSPDKEGFPNLVEKLKALDVAPYAWPEEEFAKIDTPTLLIFGDADVVLVEHAAKMYRLLGGTTNGDTVGLANVQMMVLPGSTHVGVFYTPQNLEILKSVVPAFLSAKMPPERPSFM